MVDCGVVSPDGSEICRLDEDDAHDEHLGEEGTTWTMQTDPCGICGLSPCDCDLIYDTWKERDL